jgi:hypothetical protein
MLTTRWLVLPVAALLAGAAQAQQPLDAAQAALVLSLDLQKKAVAAQDLAGALAAAKNRIVELEKLCGEACKPLAEVKKE